MREGGFGSPSFGARPVEGGVHFRLWAPASHQVEVVLYEGSVAGGERVYPLAAESDGFFGGLVREACVGSLYRYRLDGEAAYPDPASRSQPHGVHGPSEVLDPAASEWKVDDWPERGPGDLVIYEMHIGSFTPEGTFEAAIERLPDVAALGVTAVEPMPIANFPGDRNWGYDGVNLFAPATAYGGANGFKRFVDAAHGLGLSVILDVVYNHFGPEGNYLPAITGGRFFTARHSTPWGDAVNYDGPDSRPIRDFVIENALHWLCEYRVDGLRLDATHAIIDDSPRHLLAELVDRVAAIPGRRRILIAEDERNDPALVTSREQGGYGLDAVWSDDLHHQLRRLTAGDAEGYFAHYAGTVQNVVSTLRQGWWRHGRDATSLPPERFVHCIQNHDQVGNRAFGNRLNHDVPGPVFRGLSALLLASPYVPLLWMGQEWAASTPFLYFTDHPEELGRLVTRGRREEFAHFSAFHDPVAAASIPDPQAEQTFLSSKLRWDERAERAHAGTLALYRELLRLRASHPALRTPGREGFAVEEAGAEALLMKRTATGGATVLLALNFGGELRVAPGPGAFGEGRPWRLLLATEEVRFGGDGDWGALDGDGSLRLHQPGAVLIELARLTGDGR